MLNLDDLEKEQVSDEVYEKKSKAEARARHPKSLMKALGVTEPAPLVWPTATSDFKEPYRPCIGCGTKLEAHTWHAACPICVALLDKDLSSEWLRSRALRWLAIKSSEWNLNLEKVEFFKARILELATIHTDLNKLKEKDSD